MSEIALETRPIQKLNKIIFHNKTEVVNIYMFSLMAGLLQLSLPLGIQTIVGFVIAGSISTSIVVLVTLVLFGVFINGFLQIRQIQIIEKIKQKIFLNYAIKYCETIPQLNIDKLRDIYLPKMANHFFETVSLQKGVDKLLLDLPMAVIQIILGLLLLSFYHPLFIVFGLGLLLLIYIMLRLTSLKGYNNAYVSSSYKYQVVHWLQEIARNVRSLRFKNGTALQLKITDDLTTKYLQSRTEHFKVILVQSWSFIWFKLIITAAMLILGTYLLVNQLINIGQFIAADIVIIAILASIEKIITNLDSVYDSLVSAEKIDKLPSLVSEIYGDLKYEYKQEGITVNLKDVQFSAKDNIINANFKKEEIIYIKDDTNNISNYLFAALTGEHDIYSGQVLLNDIPINHYDVRTLRNSTSILLDSQKIFEGTILENITVGNDVNMDDVTTLADITGLHKLISRNPQGYKMKLLPEDENLSNRNRKSILLIRALTGNSNLILLHEPFEYMNADKVNKILTYVKNNIKATVIIVSQHDNTSLLYDKIITL
jgi:ATP-binding cassette, subfamily B, bacterial